MELPPPLNGMLKLLTPLGLPRETTQQLCRDIKAFHDDPQHPNRKTMKHRDPHQRGKQYCRDKRPPVIWSYVDKALYEFLNQYGERYFGSEALTTHSDNMPLYERTKLFEKISLNFEGLRKAMLYLSRNWQRQKKKERRSDVQLPDTESERLCSVCNEAHTHGQSPAECSNPKETQDSIDLTPDEESNNSEQSDFVPGKKESDNEFEYECNNDSTGRTTLHSHQPPKNASIFDVASDSDSQMKDTRSRRQNPRSCLGEIPYECRAAPQDIIQSRNNRPSKFVRFRMPKAWKETLVPVVSQCDPANVGKKQQKARKIRTSVDRLPVLAPAPVKGSVPKLAVVPRPVVTPYNKILGSESFPLTATVLPNLKQASARVTKVSQECDPSTETQPTVDETNLECAPIEQRPGQTKHFKGEKPSIPLVSDSIPESTQKTLQDLLSRSKGPMERHGSREITRDSHRSATGDGEEPQNTDKRCPITPYSSGPTRLAVQNSSSSNPEYSDLIDLTVADIESKSLNRDAAFEEILPPKVTSESRFDCGVTVENVASDTAKRLSCGERALVDSKDIEQMTHLRKLSNTSLSEINQVTRVVEPAARTMTSESPLFQLRGSSYPCKRSAPIISEAGLVLKDRSSATPPPSKRSRLEESANTDGPQISHGTRKPKFSKPKVVVYISRDGRCTPWQHGDPSEHDVQSFFFRVAQVYKLQNDVEAINFFCADVTNEEDKRYRLLRDDDLGYLNIFSNKIALQIKKKGFKGDFRVLVEPQTRSEEEEDSKDM